MNFESGRQRDKKRGLPLLIVRNCLNRFRAFAKGQPVAEDHPETTLGL